jgi:hypothetical protein
MEQVVALQDPDLWLLLEVVAADGALVGAKHVGALFLAHFTELLNLVFLV